MSLLMEALRKAEEAKRKVTQDQQAEAFDTSETTAPTETETHQIPAQEPTPAEPSTLSMVPMEEPSLESHFQAETDTALNARPNNQQQTSERESKQTASALFQAKRPSQQNKRNKILALVALILLLPVGGMLYWLYGSSSASNYPVNSLATTERSFFGEASTQEQVLGSEPALLPPSLPSKVESEVESEVDIATGQTAANTPTQPDSSTLVVNTSPSSVTAVTPTVNALPLTRTSTVSVIDPQLQAAFASYQQGKLTLAQEQYQNVLNKQSNNRDAMLGLASVHLKQGNTAAAQSMYSRLLKLNPRDPLARAGLLESSQSTDPLRQESELKSLLALHPDVAPLAFALGNLYASQNRWSEAQNEYFNALRIAKANNNGGAISPDYAFNLAIGLERLKQLKPAYNYYQDALELARYSPPGFDLELLNRRLAYLERTLQ